MRIFRLLVDAIKAVIKALFQRPPSEIDLLLDELGAITAWEARLLDAGGFSRPRETMTTPQRSG